MFHGAKEGLNFRVDTIGYKTWLITTVAISFPKFSILHFTLQTHRVSLRHPYEKIEYKITTLHMAYIKIIKNPYSRSMKQL